MSCKNIVNFEKKIVSVACLIKVRALMLSFASRNRMGIVSEVLCCPVLSVFLVVSFRVIPLGNPSAWVCVPVPCLEIVTLRTNRSH